MRKQTVEQIEISLKRWHSRLKRAVTAIDKLEKAKRRAVKAEAEYPIRNAPVLPQRPEPEAAPAASPAPAPAPLPPTDDLSIPASMLRPAVTPEDLQAIMEIRESQEARKKAKAAGRIAKLKAKQRGELTAMPVSGKAALARINEVG